MKRLVLVLALVAALVSGGFVVTSAQGVTVEQQRAFGTFAKNSTVCVGPMSRTDGGGMQLFGFTNGASSLTWQLRTVSSQGPPVVVFQTTATSVSHVDTTTPAGLFDACVIKTAGTPQDFDISLTSPPVE